MGVWIDERGRIVRPAEPAWAATRTDVYGGKPLAIEGEAYVAALRDWVANGDKSEYVLSDEEFARRVKPRSATEMEAEASFKLAVWFQQAGDAERATKYFERAQALNPDDWNYHRQEWSFTGDAGKKWLEKFKGYDKEYYPKLELKKKGQARSARHPALHPAPGTQHPPVYLHRTAADRVPTQLGRKMIGETRALRVEIPATDIGERSRAIGRVTGRPQRADRSAGGQDPKRRDAGHHWHRPARAGFHQGVATPLVMTADDEEVGGTVERGHLIVRHGADQPDAIRE